MRKPWREEQLSVGVGVSRRFVLKWSIELTSNTTDLVNDAVDHLFADGVVTTSIYTRQYLCMSQQLLDTHSCWQRPPCR
jgi:hypothetical protein